MPRFMIFGYSGLAMIFFLIAATGGLLFAVIMLINDERPGRGRTKYARVA
jgi:hypothetical protein